MDFAAVMAQRGGVGTDKVFCGTYQGVPFTSAYLSGNTAGKTVFLLSVQFGQKVPNKMVKELIRGLKDRAKVMRYVNQNAIVMGAMLGGAVGGAVMASQSPATKTNVQFNGQDPTHLLLSCTVGMDEQLPGVFDDLLGAVVAMMPAYGLAPPDTCPLCKNPACDSYAFVGGAFRPVHDACVRNMAIAKHTEAQSNQLNGSYATGVIGAVLGGLVGCLPNILTILLLDGRIFVILYALIPLCGYYGYKLLGGKLSRGAFWITAAVSVLLAPLTDIVSIAILVYTEYGFRMSLADIPTLFGDSAFLGDIGLSLLFVVVGIFIMSGITRRNNSHTIQDAAFSASTLRPIGQ